MAAKLKESGKAIDITNWRDWPMYHDEPSIETTEQAEQRIESRHKTVMYSVVDNPNDYKSSIDSGIVDYD